VTSFGTLRRTVQRFHRRLALRTPVLRGPRLIHLFSARCPAIQRTSSDAPESLMPKSSTASRWQRRLRCSECASTASPVSVELFWAMFSLNDSMPRALCGLFSRNCIETIRKLCQKLPKHQLILRCGLVGRSAPPQLLTSFQPASTAGLSLEIIFRWCWFVASCVSAAACLPVQ